MRRIPWLLAVLALAVLGCNSKAAPFFPPVADAGGGTDGALDGSADGATATDGPTGSDMGNGCPATQTVCNGTCASLSRDPNNCGSCGHVCPTDTVCADGTCHMMCPMGLQSCPLLGADGDAALTSTADGGDGGPVEICVDTMNSRFNCGACGRTCAPSETCGYGRCFLDCGARTLCDPTMMASGGDGGTTDGAVADVSPVDAGMDGATDGGSPTAPYCADLTYDPDNCGACGHACSAGHMCESSMCVLDCVIPEMGCPRDATHPDGYCANFTTDPMNCGACGRTCAAGQTCSHGTCVCASPQLACGALCVDPRTDPLNCGACGHAVTATQYCAGGSAHDCTAPSTLCPGGVCTNLMTDAMHCGTCGTACPTGNTCVGGVCICPPGSMVCSGTCVNLATNVMNCGACGHACTGTMVCLSGTCAMPLLYHGWPSPVPGCSTTTYNTTAPTNLGGTYPFITGDSNACRAWKLAATVCTTPPMMYEDAGDFSCPMSGGFTDPVFGTYCPVPNQYSCSGCPGACNAACIYNPLSLRNCSGAEANQP